MAPGADASNVVKSLDEAKARGAVVGDDRPCLRCGYNVHLLPVAAACPECGSPIEHSLMGDLLRYADHAWVLRLRRGCLLVLLGVAAMIASMCIMPAVGTLVDVWSAARGVRTPQSPTPALLAGVAGTIALAAVGLISSLLWLFGCWMLSSPDPGRAESSLSARRLVRWSASVMIVTQLISSAVVATGARMTPWPAGAGSSPPVHGVTAIVALSSGVAYYAALIVMYFSSLIHVRSIARRIPEPRVLRTLKHLRWGSATLCVLWVVVGASLIVGGFFGLNPISPISMPAAGVFMIALMLISAPLVVATVVFLVMYLTMLLRLYGGLNRTVGAMTPRDRSAPDHA